MLKYKTVMLGRGGEKPNRLSIKILEKVFAGTIEHGL